MVKCLLSTHRLWVKSQHHTQIIINTIKWKYGQCILYYCYSVVHSPEYKATEVCRNRMREMGKKKRALLAGNIKARKDRKRWCDTLL